MVIILDFRRCLNVIMFTNKLDFDHRRLTLKETKLAEQTLAISYVNLDKVWLRTVAALLFMRH